ncbi:MAG: ATP-binding protein [Caulobacteraceae bacterium]
MQRLATLPIAEASDAIAARRCARRVAARLGLPLEQQAMMATAVSEIVADLLERGGAGELRLILEEDPEPALVALIWDKGPPAAGHVGEALGLIAAEQFMDDYALSQAVPGGVEIRLVKRLGGPVPPDVVEDEFDAGDGVEWREQNREIIEFMSRLRTLREEVEALSSELGETNRGVMALYKEIEDKSAQVRSASEARSRFHSNVSHELRTPIHSVLAISRLLLDRADGELTAEQEKQVGFIRRSAETLSSLVNDLLDLAKAEAGRLELHLTTFTAAELLAGLRGVLRPLFPQHAVELHLDTGLAIPPIRSDEAKVSQVLRNLISNALKFTGQGRVAVSVQWLESSNEIAFAVQDTGIGIAPEHLERVFEEFEQIAGPEQRRAKGTGLGLPLSRSLAELLGGSLTVASELGRGSTFTLVIPRGVGRAEQAPFSPEFRVLIADDEEHWRYLAAQALMALGCTPFEVDRGGDVLASARELKPAAFLLDLKMPDKDGYEVLEQLASDPEFNATPAMIMTSLPSEAIDHDRLARAHAVISKSALSRESLLAVLARIDRP